MTRESVYDENGELAASFCPTDVPLSDKGRAALEAMVKAVRKDMAAKSQQLDLEAIERRWERVLARKEGRQEGTVGVVAMISAMDVPDLLAALKEARAERDDALRMVLALTGTGSCRFGIHGECQEHGWLADGGCPKVRAESILEDAGGAASVASADTNGADHG